MHDVAATDCSIIYAAYKVHCFVYVRRIPERSEGTEKRQFPSHHPLAWQYPLTQLRNRDQHEREQYSCLQHSTCDHYRWHVGLEIFQLARLLQQWHPRFAHQVSRHSKASQIHQRREYVHFLHELLDDATARTQRLIRGIENGEMSTDTIRSG